MKQPSPDPERAARVRRALTALAVTVGAGLLAYRLRAVLAPILLAFIIAYAADPVVDVLERRRVPRWLGSVLVLLGILGAVSGFVLLLVPAMIEELSVFAAQLPDRLDRGLAVIEPWVQRRFDVQIPHSIKEATERWGGQLQAAAPRVIGPAGEMLQTALGGVKAALGALLQALLVPVFAYYLLVDFDRIVTRVRAVIPPRFRPQVGRIFAEIDRTMAGFFRGQLTVMILEAALYATALGILGVPLGIGIGIMTGLLLFIPYVGVGIGLVLSLVMTLLGFKGTGTLVGVLGVFAVINLLDALVITPRIVGDKVGLGPLAVIVALMAGGELFGFLGVLLAVPLAAVAKILFAQGLQRYLDSEAFGSEAERAAARRELEAVSERAQEPPATDPPPGDRG